MGQIKITDNNKYLISPTLEEYLNPEYIYIPTYQNNQISLKKNEIIKKEQIIEGNNNNILYFSSISGNIVGFETNYIKIANNYKEEIGIKKTPLKDMSSLKPNDLINMLFKLGVKNENNELLGEIFKEHKNPKYIVIKCFDDDPYTENAKFIIKNHIEDLLFTLDELIKILEVSEAIILLKSKDSDIITKYNSILGTYPKIKTKLIPNLYPLNDELIKENIFRIKEHKDANSLILSIESILSIFTSIKKQKPITDKYVTIIGNALEENKVVKVKLYTKVSEIISNCVKLKEKDVIYSINGTINGKEVKNIDEVIIDFNIKNIIIRKKERIENRKCINCGLCYKICPGHTNPKSINTQKCINCGICSYVCPVNIKLPLKGGKL